MNYPELLFREFNQGVRRARTAYDAERLEEDKPKRPPPNPRRRAGQRLAPCGSFSAYKRHIKYGEPVDDACAEACTAQAAVRRPAVAR